MSRRRPALQAEAEDSLRRKIDRAKRWGRDQAGANTPQDLAEDAEILADGPDKTLNGLPREASLRAAGAKPKGSALWGAKHVDLEAQSPPVFGGFPQRFLPWALKLLRCQPSEILHVCSGGLPAAAGGIRVDIRQEARPDIVADGARLPFRDGAFRGVLIDPPYTVEYARALYGTAYPRPSHLLREAVRVVRPSGRVGLLHFLVPHSPPGARLVGVWGVWQGCGYRIRAFTVLEREQPRLDL